MRVRRPSPPGEARGSVFLHLEFNKPFCLPGEELGCRLLIDTEKPLRYRAISAELTCCEKFFVEGSRLTKIPHRCVAEISGPGVARPPRKSLCFSISIPCQASPTYVGSSILRIWRVKALVELGLAPNISVEEALFVVGSVSQEGRRSAFSSRGPLRLDIHLKKGLFFPGEALEGAISLSQPSAVRSLRVEVLALERLHVEHFREVSLARCLRRIVLPVKKTAYFVLQAPNYSSFIDVCSSATYVLRAIASLRVGGELVADLPISIGVLRTSGAGGAIRTSGRKHFDLLERKGLRHHLTHVSPLWS